MVLAEQVELLMIGGMLRRLNYEPKSPIPKKFKMGTGHMLFWVNKLIYLKRRHEAVKKEVARRGFKVTDKEIDLNEFPKKFHNDWSPTLEDSKILRERLVWKLHNKPHIWRYCRTPITDVSNYVKDIQQGELFEV